MSRRIPVAAAPPFLREVSTFRLDFGFAMAPLRSVVWDGPPHRPRGTRAGRYRRGSIGQFFDPDRALASAWEPWLPWRLASMDLRCERCRAQYVVSDDRVPEHGVTVTCARCGHVFRVRKKALVVTVPLRPGEGGEPVPIEALADGEAPAPAGWQVRC